MKKAIIQIQSKNFQVTEGCKIKVNRLNLDEKTSLENMPVVLYANDQEVKVGQPFLTDIEVILTKEKDFLGKKVMINKFHRRKRYRKSMGHRQKLSQLIVKEIKQK